MPNASVARSKNRPFRTKEDRDHLLESLPPIADISDSIGPSRGSAVLDRAFVHWNALECARVRHGFWAKVSSKNIPHG